MATWKGNIGYGTWADYVPPEIPEEIWKQDLTQEKEWNPELRQPNIHVWN